ncbi:MAG: cold shock domain-containing protein [Planctomycetota bacterium]
MRPAHKSEKPKKDTDGGQFIDGKFYVQRLRLGRITSMQMRGQYGFIEAEDFEDDVFFHFDCFEGNDDSPEPDHGLWIEFEIDIERFKEDSKLWALVVRPSKRPVGRKLSGRDATFKVMTRHPKARRKRPTWR